MIPHSFMMAVLEKDLRGSTDVFVSTSEIKAGKEQLDHEVGSKHRLKLVA